MPMFPNDSVALLIGYDRTVEQYYLLTLCIGTILGFLIHWLFIYFTFEKTPKDFHICKLNFSNVTFWTLAYLFIGGVLLRPVPLFPFPVAKVTGILRSAENEFWGAQLPWVTLVACVANFIIANLICFTTVAVLINDPRQRFFRPKLSAGISLAIILHLLATAAVFYAMLVLHPCTEEQKSKWLQADPTLHSIFGTNQYDQLFGYFEPDPEMAMQKNLSVPLVAFPTTANNFLSVGIAIFVAIQALYILLGWSLSGRTIFRHVHHSAFGGGASGNAMRMRIVALIVMTARQTSPIFFGALPIILLCVFLIKQVQGEFALCCALSCLALCHGFFFILFTCLAFGPYRHCIFGAFDSVHKMISQGRVGTTSNIGGTIGVVVIGSQPQPQT